MIVLIDNYDSFTFNLAQAIEARGVEVRVVRNDALDAPSVLALGARGLVLGPGPGQPCDARLCHALLAQAPAQLPILGVCLGHQVLCEHYGGVVEADPRPVHGRSSEVRHCGAGWLAGLPNPLVVGRYHSLAARREPWPATLALEGSTHEGVAMLVRHRDLPRFGVQFHPESILSPDGPELLAAFLRICGETPSAHAPRILRPSSRSGSAP
ncbi:MAG: aminodeoxychorismate/anthranilate synthase component II [Planctomycetes bacterium]|nr:aminodeoxychorismate/anthranilate synthase component II [Planctomycetota bacterium]